MNQKIKQIASLVAIAITSLYLLPTELIIAAEVPQKQKESEIRIRLEPSQESYGNVLGIDSEVTITTASIEQKVSEKQAEIDKFYRNLEQEVTKAREKKEKRDKLVSYLRNQGSPVATDYYASLIIEISEASNTDYKAIVAIMGVESGFCAVPYKRHNCFGYLNGVQYSGFEAAFRDIIPKIARDYTNVYGTNFTALAKAYGIVNYPYHSERMERYYNGL
ncbi:MAG: hypothetical protein ACOCXP_00015 [Candidatus Dojkabacteria bacterium]